MTSGAEGWARAARSTSSPLPVPRRMSEITRSTPPPEIASWAAGAPAAVVTWCPSRCRSTSRYSRIDSSSSTTSTCKAHLRSRRQFHHELRPALRRGADGDGAAVGLDDGVGGGEPQAGAAVPRGEEGFEDAPEVRGRDGAGGVPDVDARPRRRRLHAHLHLAAG